MYSRVALPLLLGMSLFLAAACGPTPAPRQDESTSPLDQPVAQAEEPAETTSVAISAPAAPGDDDSDVELDAGDADGSASAEMHEQREGDSMPVEPMPDEPAQPQAQDEYAVEMTALAVDDLSQRLGIPADQIEVREVRAVTWPDSSLGCPQPDMMYAQMLTEGLLIRLHADGEMYFYHSGGNQPPFLCEETMQMLPQDPLKSDEFVPPPGSEIDTQQTD